MTVGSGKMWSQYLDSFTLGSYANQMKTYIYALSLLYPEKHITARVFISSLAIPKRATTQRTLFTIEHIPVHLENIKETVFGRFTSIADEIYKATFDDGFFPANGHRCAGGFGMSACEFYPLCQMTTSPKKVIDFQSFLEQNYVQYKHEPWKK